MPTTATYNVYNPALNTSYYAPSAYWFVPDSGSTVTVKVQTFDSAGNLITTSSTTAIVRDASSNSDKNSFTYNGGNSVTVQTSSGTNGSDAFTSGGKVGSGVYRMAMYATYTGHAYNQPPNAPSNMSPTGGALVTTLSPTLAGSFTDPNAGNTMSQFEILVRNAVNGGGSQIWDSGILSATSAEISAARFSRVYVGPALAFGGNYSWAARVADQSGSWGPYSGWQNFSVVQGPATPGNVQPNGLQATKTPTLSFLYSSPASVNMQSYRYIIKTASGGAQVYDSGNLAQSVASGATVTGTIPAGAGLQNGQAYTFTISVIDTNGAQSGSATTNFSIATLPQVSPTSPINNATVSTQTPTFSWAYTDPNYTQQSYQVQIYNKTTGALIKDTGVVASAATSYVLSGTTIAFGTSIQWHVQVVDTAGLSSGFSGFAFALVNNTPSAAITSPANGATIPNNTPTITWTYTPSSGGFAQASAQILINDSNNNQIYSATQSGAGTSYTLPAGVLQNTQTYQIQVKVTDTNGGTGQSSVVTITVSYIPPADIQGQPLANNKNWLLSPYLNQDSGSGVPPGWSPVSQAGVTAFYSIDPAVTQPWPLANGDGNVSGAQKVGYAGSTSGFASAIVLQNVNLSNTSWVAGTTVLSLSAYCLFALASGAPVAFLNVKCFNAANATGSQLSSTVSANQGDTGGQFVRLSITNLPIPAGTVSVQFLLRVNGSQPTDNATAWWYAAMVETNATVDPNFFAGDMGTGFSFDGNGFSVRTLLAGNTPTLLANPGDDSDPVSAQGGSVTLGWDTTLADATRFQYYLIERRRQDQSNDDTAWVTITTVSNKQVGSYTDLSVGSSTSYQYSVRQVIQYPDGSTGVSAHRAIVAGGVQWSIAWYLTNQAGLLYNFRMPTVSPDQDFKWVEQAEYSNFLGRVGQARDAGPDAGYEVTNFTAFWNTAFGDDLDAIRRTIVAMQRLNTLWYLRDPEGLVVPVYLSGFGWKVQNDRGGKMGILDVTLKQAQDTFDY